MADTTRNGDILLARLAEGLDSTAKMTQALLSDLRESESDFAAVKAELNILKDNVKSLTRLIQEGDGTSSILTRVALIEQNIENIKKWMDSNVSINQNIKDNISNVRSELSEIERRLSNIESVVQQFVTDKSEEDKNKRATINRELELEHERKKTNTQIQAERKSAMIKIISAVLIGLCGIVGGYLTSQCSKSDINIVNKIPSSISSAKP